jgi:chitodextrinase
MTTVTVSAGTLNYVITGLSQGTTYDIQVQTLNSDLVAGLSPGNSILYAKTTLSGQPSDPHGIGLTKAPTSNEIVIIWQDASTNGGTDISEYNIRWRPADGIGSATTNVNTYMAENLIEGSRYTFTITAMNVSGDVSPGLAKFSASTNPSNARQDPDGFTLGTPPGPNSIGLQWVPPTEPAEVTLSGYVITWQPPDNGGIAYAGQYASSTVVTGLSANTQYVFNIYTASISGLQTVYSPGNFYVTGRTTQEGGIVAPYGFELVNGSVTTSSATFMWNAARTSDPADYVKFYTITAQDGSGHTIIQNTDYGELSTPPPTQLTFTNLSANTEYSFSLTATSDFSLTAACLDPQSISVITDGVGKPSDPRFAVVEGEVTTYSVLLNWSAALTNGGANISGYIINWSNGDDSGTATTSANVRQYRVTSLSPFTKYNVTIKAQNLSGFYSSGQNTITTLTAFVNGPRSPTGFMLDPYIATTPSSISVVWESAPTNGGSMIEKYLLSIFGPNNDFNYEVYTPANRFTYSDLADNTEYSLYISALNADGIQSPPFAWWTHFKATTAINGMPGDPTFLRVASPGGDTDNSVSIMWNTANTNGGSDISGYQVTWTPQ